MASTHAKGMMVVILTKAWTRLGSNLLENKCLERQHCWSCGQVGTGIPNGMGHLPLTRNLAAALEGHVTSKQTVCNVQKA